MAPAVNCVLVGSDSSWVGSVERHLQTLSFRVRTLVFLDPLLALDSLLGNEPDLVIAELVMPEVHGLLFVEAARQFGYTMPIVLVSSEASIEAEALASGADAFVVKAETGTELLRRLEQFAPGAPAAKSRIELPSEPPVPTAR